MTALGFGSEPCLLSALVRDNTAELDFDEFVAVVDGRRRIHVADLQKCAGFSEQEIAHFREVFEKHDKDHGGDIAGRELTSLLHQLGIPVVTAEDQQSFMELIDEAHCWALEAGVEDVCIKKRGAVTFWALVQLIRILHGKADLAEDRREQGVVFDMRFKLKEVQEFRQIFNFWACNYDMERGAKCVWALIAEDRAAKSASTPAAMLETTFADDDGGSKTLPLIGMHRMLRSLGIKLSGKDLRHLEDMLLSKGLIERGPTASLEFTGFLQLMRWMLDSDFAEINKLIQDRNDRAAVPEKRRRLAGLISRQVSKVTTASGNIGGA
eukprot:gnl/TRDRNA2_/TRDRNA2_143420_c0_seq1.p1 gnl/TRDRNA2_/TRDRNA2_143420_c0~~gnl/TRDRNA2_/TRDRNA2_143420_c0_seq1.p1  ORF type:complete len:333 (+),score=81.78 gnl/TRDRNA2_/TRDRNA2_143420_c0_seq1:29-1000(+)